ncbi:MAG: hypothetical protein MSH60_09720 [Ruminococcus sp.]|nr:hypothetical protein [Ruminococcus sp.]
MGKSSGHIKKCNKIKKVCTLTVQLSFLSTAFVISVSLWNPRRGDNLIGEGDRKNPTKRGLSPSPNGFPLCTPLSLSPLPLFPALHFGVVI